MAKNKQKRVGLFYISNGKWVGPYAGKTFTKYTASRNPVKDEIDYIKNNLLKSRIKILPVD